MLTKPPRQVINRGFLSSFSNSPSPSGLPPRQNLISFNFVAELKSSKKFWQRYSPHSWTNHLSSHWMQSGWPWIFKCNRSNSTHWYDDWRGWVTVAWIKRQFPLQLAFAMTINKSQGQTFNRVGCTSKINFSVLDNSMLLCPKYLIRQRLLYQLRTQYQRPPLSFTRKC